MQTKKQKPINEVHILTQKTNMKFIPKNFDKQKKKSQQIKITKTTSSIASRFSFSSLIWNSPKQLITRPQSQIKQFSASANANDTSLSFSNVEQVQISRINQRNPSHVIQNPNAYKLKYAYKLSPEHILIGNQFQLDLISILGINTNKFVQTEYLWSINSINPIQLVAIDQKKLNLLAIVAGKNLIIYKYDSKKLTTQPPLPFKQIQLQDTPKFIQIVKDGNICLFYSDKLQIYLVLDHVRKRYDKKYQKPPHIDHQNNLQYNLFMVPQSFDNIINIFFQQKHTNNKKIFTLWCIQIEFLTSEIKNNPPQKIYQIKTNLKKYLYLKNYSKDIFLMNLGNEILALKKGYILHSATVNLKHDFSFLQYIGNDTLLHISQKKIQVYAFTINVHVKPYRIIIKPKDSIRIQQNGQQDEFFKVLNILADDLIFIYQKDSQTSNSKCGQIHYSFYITSSISRQAKINLLFPFNTGEDFKVDDPTLLDKCDMAQKMGLSTRQIFLQLWNRSLQSRKQDYSLLVATKDYNTINQQIIRKLKKSSMNFKQIQNIQQACFAMLDQKVFSISCTQQAVMDYISSHFFRRKLQMFKDIQLMGKFLKQQQTGQQQNQGFKMTIRQYQQYKSMQIKSYLIQLVNQFCHQGKKSLSKNIRLMLRNFKFVFRIIYLDILQSIIKNARDHLLDILKQIPQLLPYHPPQRQTQTSLQIPVGFYQGVWPQISRQQWSSSLYVDAITTIDNKQIIMQQVIKNINFKRNWLSQHDMVIDSVQKIKINYQKIKSPLTLYFFCAKIFQYIQNQNVLKQIVVFLQATYDLPVNLKGTIFLNQRLYRFFVQKNIAPEINGRPYTLTEFFSFEDKQLIRHCFQKQRSNKGLLLKDIKDIFKEVLDDQADQKYNTALLNYFISDLSEVSDLKYILNRINNQKLQFHKQNQKMYMILVEALQRKLKIGTANDIPIQEVLMYIENIPLQENSDPLTQLKSISMIEKDSEMLRQAMVNMSVYDILHNPESVFTKLIGYLVDTAPLSVWQDEYLFNEFIIKNLAKLQLFAQDVYQNPNHNRLIFYLFLTKLCQSIQRIKFADCLLKGQQFQLKVDQNAAQGLVLYMLRWKFSQQKQYLKNQQYILQLLKLVPTDSFVYKYKLNQFQFAKCMSADNYPTTYPISDGNLTASDIRDLIFYLPIQFVMKLDVQHLYQVVWNIQEALIQEMNQNQQFQGEQEQLITAVNRITFHQIYQFVIIKMINSNKMREVLPYIREILNLGISNPTYNIIYLILYIIQLSSELTQSNKVNLTQCISHYFYNPIGLLQILQYIMTKPLSTHQVRCYIEQAVQRGKQQHKGYNENNAVFDQNYISVIIDVETEANFMITLNKTAKHMQQAKQQFKNIKYSAIMIMLCNSPYALAKYISCSYNYDLNVKSIRSFLSYAISQTVFKPLSILQLGRRIFLVLLESLKNRYPIQVVIQNYQQISLQNDTDIQGYEPPTDKTSFEYLMWKSAQAFKKKKLAYLNQMRNKAHTPQDNSIADKTEKIKSQLDQIPPIQQRDPCQYPFPQIDSDNEGNDGVEIEDSKIKKKNRQPPKFDASLEMKNILQFQKRPHKLFLSTRGEVAHRLPNNLSVSIRHPGKGGAGYESNKQLKVSMKSKQKVPHFEQVVQLGQSQDFHDRSQQLRPAKSAVDPQSRHSADSSPQIMHASHRYDDRVKQEDKHQESPIEKSNGLQESSPYQIQVKQVSNFSNTEQQNSAMKPDEELEQPQIIPQTTSLDNITQQLAKVLIEINKQALENPLADFNTEFLQSYSNDKNIITGVLKQIYKQNYNQPNFNKMMKMMGEIVTNYPITGINNQIFGVIIKAQEAQAKTIPQIKFIDLISSQALVKRYDSKRSLFQELYRNLSKYVDSQNIYKITQFIRRVFDNSQYQQQVTWDFILQLCDRLQNSEQQDRNWNVQKIQANLAKVQISIWNKKFTNFENKVLHSSFKDQLLQVFCNYLLSKKGNNDAIIFLQKLTSCDDSQIVSQTLENIKQ